MGRDGRQSPEIWVACNSIIYDVTDSPLFKDGLHYLNRAGQDLTAKMGDAPHMADVLNKFPIVGELEKPS